MKKDFLRFTILTISSLVLAMILMFGISFNNNQIQAQSDLKELKGYAWSSNIGWISMNCSNDNSCDKSDYKVILDEDTGNLTGYAWSSNVGWLQFGGLSDFPEGNGTQSINARINPDTNEMEGWARFLSFGDDVIINNIPGGSDVIVEPISSKNGKNGVASIWSPTIYWSSKIYTPDSVYSGQVWPKYFHITWDENTQTLTGEADSTNMVMDGSHLNSTSIRRIIKTSSPVEVEIVVDEIYSSSNDITSDLYILDLENYSNDDTVGFNQGHTPYDFSDVVFVPNDKNIRYSGF